MVASTMEELVFFVKEEVFYFNQMISMEALKVFMIMDQWVLS